MCLDDVWVNSVPAGTYWMATYSYSNSGSKCTANRLPTQVIVGQDQSVQSIPNGKGVSKHVYNYRVFSTKEKAMEHYTQCLSDHLSLVNSIFTSSLNGVLDKATKLGTKGLLTSLPEYNDLINTIRKYAAEL